MGERAIVICCLDCGHQDTRGEYEIPLLPRCRKCGSANVEGYLPSKIREMLTSKKRFELFTKAKGRIT